MQQYQNLLNKILYYGNDRPDRTGTGTKSIFGHQMDFDLLNGFPLVTTKKIFFDSVKKELLWMLSGSTNVNDLDAGIWDEWADEDGELGPVYGKQWRSWPTSWGGEVDQIQGVINSLQRNPYSRRHIVSAWNVGQLEDMALPPCHVMFQFHARDIPMSRIYDELNDEIKQDIRNSEMPTRKYIEKKLGAPTKFLDCQVYQRSADTFIGLPFNIASYALLTHLMAHEVNMMPGRLVHTLGDAHLYKNHVELAEKQLEREPRGRPRLKVKLQDSIFDYTPEDIQVEGYNPHPHIEAEVAV